MSFTSRLPRADVVTDREQLLDGDGDLQDLGQRGVLAGLDALGDLDLALAGEQRDRAHLAQVHAHRDRSSGSPRTSSDADGRRRVSGLRIITGGCQERTADGMAAEQLEHFLELLGRCEQVVGQDAQELGALDVADSPSPCAGAAGSSADASRSRHRCASHGRRVARSRRSRSSARALRARSRGRSAAVARELRLELRFGEGILGVLVAPLGGNSLGQTGKKRLDLPHLLLQIVSPRDVIR